MLSVLFAESGDNLARLVEFYAPRAVRVLDVTYGNGTLSKRLRCPVIGVDRDPATTPSVRADSCALPFRDGSFEVAVYDPPYLYGTSAMHMGPIGEKTWSNVRSTWKRPEELRRTSAGIARELARVLSPDGLVICKVMDSRYRGRLIRNHDLVIEAFEDAGFRLRDQVIYIRTVTGSYVNNKSAQSTHGYFLMLEREAQAPLLKTANVGASLVAEYAVDRVVGAPHSPSTRDTVSPLFADSCGEPSR